MDSSLRWNDKMGKWICTLLHKYYNPGAYTRSGIKIILQAGTPAPQYMSILTKASILQSFKLTADSGLSKNTQLSSIPMQIGIQ